MKKIYLFITLLVCFFTYSYGQSFNMGNLGTVSNACGGNFYDSGGSGSNYSGNQNYTATFCAPAGQYISFAFSSFNLGSGDYLYVYNGANTSATLIGNYAGTTNPGVVTSTLGGCLTFVFTSNTLFNGPGWAAAITCPLTPPPIPGGTTCASANPFCTGTTYNFPNNTGVASLGGGGIYGCLGSTPNPVWYFFQVANSGNIDISIGQTNTGGSGIDVDFVLWGPFASQSAGCGALSSTNIIDCSYSIAATETANITGAVAGQFYVLLLTNYANQAGNISFSQSSGAGSTNCNVLCNMTGLTAIPSACDPVTNQYSLTGNINFQYPPSSGNLTITSSCGGSTTIAAPWTSPLSYTLTGLTSNGAACNVTAAFSADATCTLTQAYPAPASCSNCTVTAGNTGPVCTNGSFGLTSTSVTNGTYAWTGPNGYTSSSQNPTGITAPSTAGTLTYTLNVTTPSGTCTSQTTVTVNATPQVSAGTSQTITCSQTNSLLDGSSTTPGATLVWNGPGTVNAADPLFVTTAGTYTVTASLNGCSATDNLTINSNLTPPVPAASTPDGTVLTCSVPSVSLSGSATPAGSTLVWSATSGPLAGNPVSVSAPGTYTLTATDPSNGCTATSTVAITASGGTPNISVTTNPNTTILTCLDTVIVLTGASTTPNITDEWSGPNGVIVGNPISINTPGTYTYQVTDNNNGCQSSTSINITRDVTPPAVQISAPNSVITCLQTSVSLVGTSSTSNVSYAWSGPSGAISGNPINVAAAGTYSLTVTNLSNGCTSNQTQSITVDNTPPNVGITAPSTVLTCLVSTVSLQGTSTTAGTQIAWNGPTGASASNPLSTSVVGTYTVDVLNPTNGCVSTQTIAVTENIDQPNVVFDTPLGTVLDCNTPTVTLNGTSNTPNTTLVWSGASGNIVGNPATVGSPGTYTLTATDGTNGCTTIATTTVTSTGGTPNISYTQSSPALTCAITSVTLTGASTNSSTTISWVGTSGPIAGNPIVVNTAGSYTVTVTDNSTGCLSTNSTLVRIDTAAPNASVLSSISVLTCSSPNANIVGSSTTPGVSYAWAGPSGVIAGNPINVSAAGTYTVVVANPTNSCISSRTVALTSNTTPPTISINSNSTELTCSNTNIVLTATGTPSSVSYTWSGAATGTNPIVNASSQGSYNVSATDPANGCSNSATIIITRNAVPPSVNAGTDQTVNCNGTPVTLSGLSGTPNVSYAWSGPSLFSASTQTTSTNIVGTYTLTATDPANGCTATDLVSVLTNTNVPNANAGLNQSIKCNKPVVALTGSSTTAGVSYSWAGPSIVPPAVCTTAVCSTSVVGNYTLTVTNTTTGCSSTDVAIVTSTPAPNAGFTATPTSGTVPLAVTFANTSTASNVYSWTFGNGSTSNTANPSTVYDQVGTYTVTLISSIGTNCKDTATVVIEVKPVSQVIIPNIFSPNGDNVNEQFKATTTGITELTIDIFDRWGLKKSSFNGLTSFWTGEGSSEGTYFYIAKGRGIDGQVIDQQGFFMLVR